MLLFCFHLFVKLPNCYKLMLWCVIFSAFMFGDNYGMTVIILSTCLCVMLTICTVNWTLAWSPPILISFNIVIYFMAFACICIVFFAALWPDNETRVTQDGSDDVDSVVRESRQWHPIVSEHTSGISLGLSTCLSLICIVLLVWVVIFFSWSNLVTVLID